MTKRKSNPQKGGRPRKYEQAVEKSCRQCGGAFTATTPYAIERQTLCSLECRNAWNTSERTRRVPWTCPACGARKQLTPFRASTRKFCSYSCANSVTSAGENNGQWKGGNAKFWKRKARERDDFTCQFPGCGFQHRGQRTHAHHKIPRLAGGPDVLENLITLCDRHHHEIERALLQALIEKHPQITRKVVAALYAEFGL